MLIATGRKITFEFPPGQVQKGGKGPCAPQGNFKALQEPPEHLTRTSHYVEPMLAKEQSERFNPKFTGINLDYQEQRARWWGKSTWKARHCILHRQLTIGLPTQS